MKNILAETMPEGNAKTEGDFCGLISKRRDETTISSKTSQPGTEGKF